ncbi:MAG: aminotransferase class I/II-fold pyridoxal phosphate-dependent enzyme, partial [Planctomycetota bacterium]
ERWAQDTGFEIDDAAEVTVTAGATGCLAAASLGMLNPGDEVVVFEPFYDAYPADLGLAGAGPRFVPLRRQADGSFRFDPAELRAAVTGRTRAILLNTPHNPTGKVFEREELEQIAAVARDRDLVVISDEVYDRLVFEGEHIPIATLDGMRERTITIGSFGKTFSLTGWKIGWAIACPELTRAVRAAHQFLNYAVATPLQHAVAEAIARLDEAVPPLVAELQARRNQLAPALRGMGMTFADPASGYFILADFSDIARELGWEAPDDVRFCHHLIDNAGVATIPPTSFYRDKSLGANLIRIAFCKNEKTIRDAVGRLQSVRPA